MLIGNGEKIMSKNDYKRLMDTEAKNFAKELAGKTPHTFPVGGKIKDEAGEGKLVHCSECGKEKKLVNIGFVSNTKRICDKCLKEAKDKTNDKV